MAVSEGSFNLANWEEHPTDNRYFVFRFNKKPQADLFSEFLRQEGVAYEEHEEDGLRLFAVHRNDFDKARKLDYLVMAEHREPMIKNGFLRWGLVLFMVAAVTIALIGHCNKKESGSPGFHEAPLKDEKSAV